MRIGLAEIVELRRYLELDERARSAQGVSFDEAIERRHLGERYEEVLRLRVLLDQLEELLRGNK